MYFVLKLVMLDGVDVRPDGAAYLHRDAWLDRVIVAESLKDAMPFRGEVVHGQFLAEPALPKRGRWEVCPVDFVIASPLKPDQVLPKRCQPRALQPAPRPEIVTYAIGVEQSPGSFGMIGGPTPNLNEMLEWVGEDKAVIFRGNLDGTTEQLYKWQADRWVRVPKEER